MSPSEALRIHTLLLVRIISAISASFPHSRKNPYQAVLGRHTAPISNLKISKVIQRVLPDRRAISSRAERGKWRSNPVETVHTFVIWTQLPKLRTLELTLKVGINPVIAWNRYQESGVSRP